MLAGARRCGDALVGILALVTLAGPRLVQAQAPPAAVAPASSQLLALPSCGQRTEHHQLDFWLGEWDVFDAGQLIARSSIQRLARSCALQETYLQADGYSGQSVNFYDATLRKWRQTWVDQIGTVAEFTGEAVDGGMTLIGETHTVTGRVILRRMRLAPVGDDQVRQSSQRSDDGGATWHKAYDYQYRRRGPRSG